MYRNADRRPSWRANPSLRLAVYAVCAVIQVRRLLSAGPLTADLLPYAAAGLAVGVSFPAIEWWVAGRYTLDALAIKLVPRRCWRPEDYRPESAWEQTCLFVWVLPSIGTPVFLETKDQLLAFSLPWLLALSPLPLVRVKVWRRACEMCRERSG